MCGHVDFGSRRRLAPLVLGAEGRVAWERIVRRMSGELGPVTVGEYPTHLELWRRGPAGTFQLCHFGDSAGIEIPYRHPGATALPIMVEAYRAAVIVAEETGMEAHDFEVGQPVLTGDVSKAGAWLGGITAWALKNLT